MRILFNNNLTDSLSMLNKMKEWAIELDIYESNMEDTWNFKYCGIDFYLQYDRNSLNNKNIFQFVCESHGENNCEGTEQDREATVMLYAQLKSEIPKILLEKDE